MAAPADGVVFLVFVGTSCFGIRRFFFFFWVRSSSSTARARFSALWSTTFGMMGDVALFVEPASLGGSVQDSEARSREEHDTLNDTKATNLTYRTPPRARQCSLVSS